MHKIGNDTPTADVNGEFRETSTPTDLRANWANTVQRELVAVVEDFAGETLDPENDTQISDALNSRQYGRAANSPAAAASLGLTYEPDLMNHIVSPTSSFISGVYYGAGFIWATNNGIDTVIKVDPVTMVVVGLYSFGPSSVEGPVIDDGTYLWVLANESGIGDDSVYRVTISDGTILGPILVGRGPRSLVYVNGFVYVANSTTDNLSKIDPESATVVSTIALAAGASPWGMCFDGSHIWIANSANDTMSLLNPVDDSVTSFSLVAGDSPIWPIFDGRTMWVTARGRDRLIQIDIDTHQTIMELPYTAGTSDVGQVVFDGYSIYAVGLQFQSITVFKDLMWVQTQQLMDWSYGVAFDGRYIWYGTSDRLMRMLVR